MKRPRRLPDVRLAIAKEAAGQRKARSSVNVSRPGKAAQLSLRA